MQISGIVSECSRAAISRSGTRKQVASDRSRQDLVLLHHYHRVCSTLKLDLSPQGPMCPSLPVSPFYCCLATCCSGEQPPRGKSSLNRPSPWTTSGPGSGYLSSTVVRGVSQPFPSSATNMKGRSLKATPPPTGVLVEEPYTEVEVEVGAANADEIFEDVGPDTEVGSETMLTLRKNVSIGNNIISTHDLPRHNSC